MFYGTVSGATTYWAERGYTGTPTDQILRKGSIFVDGLGWRMTASMAPVSRFPGIPASDVLQWPRLGAKDVYGREIDPTIVPQAVERATYEAAYQEAIAPGVLNAVIRSDERVVREKFGSVEFQYADGGEAPGMAATTPVIPTVMSILAPVLNGGDNIYGITGLVA